MDSGHIGILAKMMLDIGHNLNMKVVATRVESAAQHEFLALHGCASMQGNLVSHPLPRADLERWLATAHMTP
jgi:EAL domain-containing protein (putative c-di-GMP-specific phosphodiesterase class I)